ncbi:MAG: hypothetical protein ACLR2G_05625 [Phascolarctobacterium faecium]
MNTSMIVYRLFDVADEINLDLVQALWTSRNKIASRLRLDRISTKSITFKDPPVLVELGSHEMELGGKTYLAEIKARIFDLGVISLIIRIPFEDDVTYDEYLDMAIVSENMPEDEIHHYLDAVLETIRPACSNERVSFRRRLCCLLLKRISLTGIWSRCYLKIEPLSVNKLAGNTGKSLLLCRRHYLSGLGFSRSLRPKWKP